MKISKEKKEKISEQILALLYSKSPQSIFTSQIAKELARDEEFVKHLLLELKKRNLVIGVNKNSKGTLYLKRMRWRLSDSAYEAYKNYQIKH
ncbi:MAG: hypothetical protein Q7R52_04840 [archaeon]|nr:hypothetical protein [archaeon]